MQPTQPHIQSVLGVLSWGKAAGREVDRSPPSSAVARNEWSYISTSQYVFMAQTGIGKGKSFPLQARSGPQGSRKLRFPDYVTMAHDGGKVVSLTHRPLFTPRKYSWYSFLLEAESTPGP